MASIVTLLCVIFVAFLKGNLGASNDILDENKPTKADMITMMRMQEIRIEAMQKQMDEIKMMLQSLVTKGRLLARWSFHYPYCFAPLMIPCLQRATG